MFNKNDPLINSVMSVMQQSDKERDAARLVNEAFGVTDRKAIPHERLGDWDALYNQVLREGVEALQEDDMDLFDDDDKKKSGKGKHYSHTHKRSGKEVIKTDAKGDRKEWKVKRLKEDMGAPAKRNPDNPNASTAGLDSVNAALRSVPATRSSSGSASSGNSATDALRTAPAQRSSSSSSPSADSATAALRTPPATQGSSSKSSSSNSATDALRTPPKSPEASKSSAPKASTSATGQGGMFDGNKSKASASAPSKAPNAAAAAASQKLKASASKSSSGSATGAGGMFDGNKAKTAPSATGQGGMFDGNKAKSNDSSDGDTKKSSTSSAKKAISTIMAKKKKLNSLSKLKEGQDPYAENEGGSAVTNDAPIPKPKLRGQTQPIKESVLARVVKKINEGFNNRHGLSVSASAEKQAVAVLNEDDIDSYENRMTAGLGQQFTPYGGGQFGGGFAKRVRSRKPGRVKASNINTRTGEPFTPAAAQQGSKARYGTMLDKIRAKAAKASPKFDKSSQEQPASAAPKTSNAVAIRPSTAVTTTQRPGAPATAIRRSATNVPVKAGSGANLPGRASGAFPGNEKGKIVGLSNSGKAAAGAIGAGLAASGIAAYKQYAASRAGASTAKGAGTFTDKIKDSPKSSTTFTDKIKDAPVKKYQDRVPPEKTDTPATADSPKVTTTSSGPKVYSGKFSDAFAQARKDAAAAGAKSTGRFSYKDASGKVKEFQTNVQGKGTAKNPEEKYVARSKQTEVGGGSTSSTNVTGGQGIAGYGGQSAPKAAASAPTTPAAKPSTSATGAGGMFDGNKPKTPISGNK